MIKTKKVAILQSNYIPWKGYFDLMTKADIFVIYDSAQFTKGDWRNRNKIKTPTGAQWLTIPVKTKGQNFQKINEVEVQNTFWIDKHLKSLEINYCKAEFFEEVMSRLSVLYLECRKHKQLSVLNKIFILEVIHFLKIPTKIVDGDSYLVEGKKNQALLSILQQIGGVTHYISGPAAKTYVDEELFRENGFEVEWMDYSNYPVYNQLHPPFVHQVSILDLLFNEGPDSRLFLKYTDKSIHSA